MKLVKIVTFLLMAFAIAGCVSKKENPQIEIAKLDYIRQDYEAAAMHLWPLVQQGDPDAEYALGYLYFYGKGVPQDVLKGRELIQRAAEKSNVQALKAIDMMAQHEASLAAFPKEHASRMREPRMEE